MLKQLRDKVTGKPSGKASMEKQVDNILELAEVVPKAARRFTKGGADGAIGTTHKLLLELLEGASKVHLLKRQVIKLTNRLSGTERKIFSRLDDTEWDELIKLARTMVEAFRSTNRQRRRGAIAALKGKMAEVVFYQSDTFQKVMRNAEDLVDTFNSKGAMQLDKATVELKKAVRSEGKGVTGELTDGLVVATRADGDYQILAIVEMKSRSNRNDLARRRSKEFELHEELEDNAIFKREGQLEADIERLSELDLTLDGEFVPAGTARFSRHDTAWIGVTPSDVELSQMQIDRIKPLISNFTQVRQEVSDRSLNRICTKLLELLSDISD